MQQSKIYVLLPAYNEEAALPILIPKFAAVLTRLGNPFLIIVADDGSSDATGTVAAALAAQYPMEVLTHRVNRGLGETARDLFERAAELAAPEDVIVRMDCDDTHDPSVVETMLKRLAVGDVDVVIGSRFQPGGGQSGVNAYRALISRAANLFMKVFFPMQGVHDYSSGFRAYRARIIQLAIAEFGNNFIQLKGLGFTGTLEKLVKLSLLGARFGEVAMMLRYDQKLSSSKMVSSVTTLGYLVMAVLYHWPWGGWRQQSRKNRWRQHHG
ncbi:MAG: glycosyltransferase [Proteobacteria bacterium]|nr:glycosyltransferase [Pseudomonadota bacterium]MBK8961230.1 glycosyltransferase [Pseudomonadota bacterium]